MPDWVVYGGAVWLFGSFGLVFLIVVLDSWRQRRTERQLAAQRRRGGMDERAARAAVGPPNVVALAAYRRHRRGCRTGSGSL